MASWEVSAPFRDRRTHQPRQLSARPSLKTFSNTERSPCIFYEASLDHALLHDFVFFCFLVERLEFVHPEVMVGSGIAVVRWLNGTDEMEEVIFQTTTASTLGGRMFKDSHWMLGSYPIDRTPGTVPAGSSIAATFVNDRNANGTLLLAYFAESGFLHVQTRATGSMSMSDVGEFSAVSEIVERHGEARAGITTAGTLLRVYFLKKIR